MRTMWKLLPGVCLLACLDEPATESTDQASLTTSSNDRRTVTRIRVNERDAFVLLVDGATGHLDALRDQLANTSTLDFSFASPDPTDPDFTFLISGRGAIPNSALTFTKTGARLAVTTAFEVTSCRVNTNDGSSVCGPGSPQSFDLTWTDDGVRTFLENNMTVETLAARETTEKTDNVTFSTLVSGTFGGHIATDNVGTRRDTRRTTTTRELAPRLRP
jgi:hypothetical protein